MRIIGGLDIHRRQITYDYVVLETGEVSRGVIKPVCRAELRLDRYLRRALDSALGAVWPSAGRATGLGTSSSFLSSSNISSGSVGQSPMSSRSRLPIAFIHALSPMRKIPHADLDATRLRAFPCEWRSCRGARSAVRASPFRRAQRREGHGTARRHARGCAESLLRRHPARRVPETIVPALPLTTSLVPLIEQACSQ